MSVWMGGGVWEDGRNASGNTGNERETGSGKGWRVGSGNCQVASGSATRSAVDRSNKNRTTRTEHDKNILPRFPRVDNDERSLIEFINLKVTFGEID